MFAEDIPRLEKRARRRGGNPRPRNHHSRGGNKIIIALGVIVVVLALAVTLWWLATQKPESLDQATGMVQQAASNVGAPIGVPKDERVPTLMPAPVIIPTVLPTSAPTLAPKATVTPAPTATPTPIPHPAPTLTAPQVLYLFDKGEITKEQATAMLHCLNMTPQADPVPTPLVTVAATPSTIPTPVAIATPRPSADLRHLDEKRYMLELINAERAKAGAGPVVLGDNIAAQLHADSALQNCFSGHWGLDGLKPYMRYSLAGGYQPNGENGLGNHYCIKPSNGFSPNGGIRREISEGMESWMGSSGHRRNILDSQHKKVNIGIAWDRYNVAFYQHFEGDYVEYVRLPAIDNGILSLAGRTKNGALFSRKEDLGIQIDYDQPPHSLTRGQVSKTYCYDNGLPVASLRWPLTGNWRWTDPQFSKTIYPCLDPYDVSADAVPPKPPSRFYPSVPKPPRPVTVPWITAQEWTASGDTFAIRANIGQVLSKHGAGVYSILVWGKLNGEDVVISQHSIFHGVTPPDTYNPSQ